MRQIKRETPEIMNLLEILWKQRGSDERFFQFIYNLQRDYSQERKNYGKVVENENKAAAYDFFNLEDADFLDFIKRELHK